MKKQSTSQTKNTKPASSTQKNSSNSWSEKITVGNTVRNVEVSSISNLFSRCKDNSTNK